MPARGHRSRIQYDRAVEADNQEIVTSTDKTVGPRFGRDNVAAKNNHPHLWLNPAADSEIEWPLLGFNFRNKKERQIVRIRCHKIFLEQRFVEPAFDELADLFRKSVLLVQL